MTTAAVAVLVSVLGSAAGPHEVASTPLRLEQPALCFAPGTPADVIAAIARRAAAAGAEVSLAAPDADPSFQFNELFRWSSTATDPCCLAQGDPTTLTWSVVPDGTPIRNSGSIAGESTDPSGLRAWLDANYGGEAGWLPIVRGVFARWGELTGITYVHETADDGAVVGSTAASPGRRGVRGDVRLAGHAIDGTASILAYNYYPTNGDMVIDTSDAVLDDKVSGSINLRNVMAHEHGHGIGLFHVCPREQTKLMEPSLSRSFDGPQPDDVLGAQRAYGDDAEPNDAPAAATPLGALPPATPRTLGGHSIDDEGDADYFSLVVADGARLSVSATPAGTTYLSGPQNANGTCSPGTDFDALRQQDLGVTVLDRDGTTVLASSDAQAAGAAETLAAVDLRSGAGTYFVRVSGKTADRVQAYTLSLTVEGAPAGSTVFQWDDPASVLAHPIAVAPSSPFAWSPPAGAVWYVQVDDGAGSPARIRLVRGASGILIHFP